MANNKQLFWLSDENTKEKSTVFGQNGLSQENAAPMALPMGVNDPAKAIPLAGVESIDVIKNFNWTNTNSSERQLQLEAGYGNIISLDNTNFSQYAGVPAIILNEYRVTFSSALANLRYQIKALGDAPEIMDSGINLLTQMTGASKDGALDKLLGTVRSTATTGIDFMSNAVGSLDPAEKFDPSGDATLKNNPHLAPYAGLYLGAPSGFRYIFPYLTSQQYRSASSQWADEGNSAIQDFVGTMAGGMKFAGQAAEGAAKSIGGLISLIPGAGKAADIGEGVGGALGGAAGLAAKAITAPLDLMGAGLDLTVNATRALTPGHSLEQTKTYAGYGQANHPISITFYLSNTHSWEEVIRNWHLMFLLQYQNLPNKNNKISLEPPVMYEVSIPGHYYSPFAFISNLQITGIGNTRTMEMPLRVNKNDNRGSLESAPADSSAAPVGDVFGFTKTGFSPAGWGEQAQPGTMRRATASNSKQHIAVKAGTPGSGSKPMAIPAVIPEAYMVTITISSLVPDSKNFTYHTIKNTNSLYSATMTKQKRNMLG